MKILIVDDSSTMRRIVSNCLDKIGYREVVQAADGVEALEVLDKQKDVGLILADWHMPIMDGFTLLREIKSREGIQNIPFIMITTQTERQSVIDALQTGAANYIVKPFTPDVISEKIAEVFERNH